MLGKPAKIVLGIATIIPIAHIVCFVATIVVVVVMNFYGKAPSKDAMRYIFPVLFVAHAGVILLILGLGASYIVHVFKADRIPESRKLLWAVAIFMGGPIAMPIYWYFNIWREPAAGSHAESGAVQATSTQTIFPILRYGDARTAIRWLDDAFGFGLVFVVPESGPFVRHAQLKLGGSIVMLGSVRPDDGLASPSVTAAPTQALCVHVEDVQAVYRRAVAAGARIVAAPSVSDVGFLEFHVSDPEGHPWIFSSFTTGR